jgi:hypothetical protein
MKAENTYCGCSKVGYLLVVVREGNTVDGQGVGSFFLKEYGIYRG